jgi:hypothetical protein
MQIVRTADSDSKGTYPTKNMYSYQHDLLLDYAELPEEKFIEQLPSASGYIAGTKTI